MVRLGCELAADYAKEARISALISDDKDSARRQALYFEDQRGHASYLWHLRARYELDRIGKTQFVEFLMPVVRDHLLATRRYKTWIDF